jgi:hypothetical protein
VEDYEIWEEILIRADYSFAFFDGINRYYIAQEHCELHSHFRCPPNVFDAFIKSNHHEALILAQQSEEEKLKAEARTKEAEARTKEAEARIFNLVSSQSWKITAPLRSLNDFVRFHVKRGIRFYCKQSLGRFENFVRRQPALNQFVLKLFDVVPALRKFFGSTTSSRAIKINREHDSSSETSNMSPHVQRIHADLKNAIERKKG